MPFALSCEDGTGFAASRIHAHEAHPHADPIAALTGAGGRAKDHGFKDRTTIKQGALVILGMSVANFTVLHVVISMIAIFAGFVVLGGMFSNEGLGGWTVFFLVMTLLTNIAGFLFPITIVTPAIVVGTISSLFVLVACYALYKGKLRGGWRVAYVVTAMIGLWLNVFVLIAQSFQKVSFLQPLAPNGNEPAFAIAQGAALVAFVLLGALALRRFHPTRVVM
jgi:hypothetical protein